MARPKKVGTPTEQTVEHVITWTQEQFSKLRDISADLNRVKNNLADIGEDRDLDDRNTGFIDGKACATINQLEDTLDEILNKIEPATEEEEDDNLW